MHRKFGKHYSNDMEIPDINPADTRLMKISALVLWIYLKCWNG